MAEEKQNVTITCTASGQPQPRVTWFKPFGSLPKDRIEVVNGTLKIYNVAKTDGGIYLCNAKNIMGSETSTAQLTIFSPLRFKVYPPQEVTPAQFGSTVYLPCVVKSDLRTTITWTKKESSSLPQNTDVLLNGTLVLRNIKKSHEGSYTCRATNALTTIEADVKINAPVAALSCSMIKKYISSKSGNYVIDPDGEGGLAPFTAFCDMTDKSGVGVTVISHDSESRTYVHQVSGYGAQGSYSRDIHYTGASLSQLASLTRVSLQCEQFIKYECYHSVLLYNGNLYGWWVSRDSQKMRYWGGASANDKCACGMTNSCSNPSNGCNCDKNDYVWREDSGLLTDKTKLPVKQLRFGDIGDSSSEYGYHTLGNTKQRREKDKQKNKIQQLLLHFRLAVVCCVLYRINSRGTQNSRTSSSDITVSNIVWPDGEGNPSEGTTELRKMANRNSEGTWHKAQGNVINDFWVIKYGVLIVNDVRARDEGFYSCRAENLLGSVNAIAKLTVQCSPKTFLSSKRLMAEEKQNVAIAHTTSGQP
ncbi:unnamed protein product [Porites evermanni]|uniref:Ig-like domain-containing protein n=1 Tax=Porites evermanni TaxID=104178 RepID=A0ABN8SXY1_9CNID|nr:unnamed protein product [Porites evermanni]